MRGPDDLLALRDEFPAVRDTVFLGAHTLAPLSRPVRAAVDRFLDLWQTEASAELVWFDHVIPEMRRLEARYAELIGADPDEVVLTPSVSTGLSSVATGLGFEEDRDEILIARSEFPTDCHVWLAQERRGARVVWVEGERSADEAAYIQALSDRTVAVSASRVSYLDGSVLDAASLAGACRDAGAWCILDDYHGSGIVPLDVHEIGCDALVGGPLKYLLGGPGTAFLYVRRDRITELEPLITGWFSQADFFAFDNSRLDWPDTAQRFALGTPSPAAVFAAAAGLDLMLDIGPERIAQRIGVLTAYTIDRADQEGYPVRTPRDPERRGGMVAFAVEDSQAVLQTLLRQERVIVDERHGALRACPHIYSSEDDVDELFAALRRIGARPGAGAP